MVRTWIAAAAGVVALGVSGCSVQPATDVTSTGATLNARLVNPLKDQTLEYHFEWGRTYLPNPYSSSSPPFFDRTLAAGSDWTDVAQPVGGLEPGTEYAYRVCGTFKPSGNTGCLPERKVITAPDPTGDVVRAGVGAANSDVAISYLSLVALSDADGGNVHGTQTGLAVIHEPFREVPLSADVTCSRVTGHTAVVGAGRTYRLTDGDGDAPDTLALIGPGPRSPGDCGPLKPDEQLLELRVYRGQIVIVDR